MSEMKRVPVEPGRRSSRRTPDSLPASASDAAARELEAADECDCPRLEAVDWHETESDWSDIAFLRGTTNAVLGVPLGYQNRAADLREKAKSMSLEVPEDGMLLLGEGRVRRPIMLEVEPRGRSQKEMTELYRPGGVAWSRLVPAPYGKMKQVVEETVTRARVKYGRKPDDVWIWYLTCRICSAPREFETLIIAHYKAR